MNQMKLTQDVNYNIVWEYRGLAETFNGKFIKSDVAYAWFDIEGINAKVRNMDIVSAIPAKR